MLIDTHTHLDFPQYDKDREPLIGRLRESGIAAIINVGIDLKSSLASVRLAETHENIYAAVGYHPHEASHLDAVAIHKISALARHEKVVAIGEIGLDYYRNYAPREVQQEAFRQQIHLARTVRLPIVIHIRQAYQDARTIMEEEKASDVGGVFHCYSGDGDTALWAIDENFSLSFTGVVTYPRNQALPVAASVPLERLLLETDCPFLTPVPHRGRRNEPSYVRFIAEAIAEARKLPVDTLADATTKNARKLFRLSDA
jgi:TatD DNase family protein